MLEATGIPPRVPDPPNGHHHWELHETITYPARFRRLPPQQPRGITLTRERAESERKGPQVTAVAIRPGPSILWGQGNRRRGRLAVVSHEPTSKDPGQPACRKPGRIVEPGVESTRPKNGKERGMTRPRCKAGPPSALSWRAHSCAKHWTAPATSRVPLPATLLGGTRTCKEDHQFGLRFLSRIAPTCG
jgi:hypothetical protein